MNVQSTPRVVLSSIAKFQTAPTLIHQFTRSYSHPFKVFDNFVPIIMNLVENELIREFTCYLG